MSAISAFILAGGKSTRMGSDKALLELWGCTLLSRACALAAEVTDNVSIVADPAKFAQLGTVIADRYSGQGPLGGIHAALSSSRTDLNLILAVDLPFIGVPLLKYLVSEAAASEAAVTVPFVVGRYQPLCAVYRKQFTEIAESALVAGRNKIDVLFSKVPIRIIDEPELVRAGFSAASFRNLNTPEEFEQARRSAEIASP